jgi:hypothetical protein
VAPYAPVNVADPRAKIEAPSCTRVWRDLGKSRPEKTPAILNWALDLLGSFVYYTGVSNSIQPPGHRGSVRRGE